MKNFKASETTLFFNSRDELVKVRLERVAYFEADANYCHVVFINGARATLLASLVNIEKLLDEQFKESASIFIRIGKRFIINRKYIFQISVLRQKLVLSDFVSPGVLEITISKDALKKLKNLYTVK